MRNALVTIDTGHLQFTTEYALMLISRTPAFVLEVHGRHAVAVAAFSRIAGFHGGPYAFSKFFAVGDKFLAGIDDAKQMSGNIPGGCQGLILHH